MKKLLLLIFSVSLTGILKAQDVDTVTKKIDITLKDQSFIQTEVDPSFIGGEEALNKFLRKKIRYPSDARKKNIQGRVWMQFIIEKDGSLSDIKVIKSPSEDLSQESIRVMYLSPKWSPGLQNGKPVRVQYSLPINYNLNRRW